MDKTELQIFKYKGLFLNSFKSIAKAIDEWNKEFKDITIIKFDNRIRMIDFLNIEIIMFYIFKHKKGNRLD